MKQLSLHWEVKFFSVFLLFTLFSNAIAFFVFSKAFFTFYYMSLSTPLLRKLNSCWEWIRLMLGYFSTDLFKFLPNLRLFYEVIPLMFLLLVLFLSPLSGYVFLDI